MADLIDYTNAVKAGLDGKAPTGHTHDDRYFTETEADGRFVRTVNGSGPDGSGNITVSSRGVLVDGLGNGDASASANTAAINAAIAAGAGGEVYIPPGRYMIDATDSIGAIAQPVGITLNQPDTYLRLAPGAVLAAIGTDSGNYSVIQVTAPGCRISGGIVEGDVGRHIGSAGEWGHCIDVSVGAHRCTVDNIIVTKAWGGGVLIAGRPEDVLLHEVRAIDNRRQGCSIIDAIRPRINGGAYINTGVTAAIALPAGIRIEPDPGTSRDVIDFVVSGVTLAGNRGNGLHVSGHERTATGLVVGCYSTLNGLVGSPDAGEAFAVEGSATTVTFKACVAHRNRRNGFFTYPNVEFAKFEGCTAEANDLRGFLTQGPVAMMVGCDATRNGLPGFYLNSPDSILSGCTGHTNCQITGTGPDFDIYGSRIMLLSCSSNSGGLTKRPQFGFVVQSGVTDTRFKACVAIGPWAPDGSNYLDMGIGTTVDTTI